MNNGCPSRNNTSNDEIKLLLEKIVAMQKEAVRGEIAEEMCDGFLGNNNDLCKFKCNTRPLQVYTDDDHPWSAPIERDEDGCNNPEKSCVLRVEKVEDGVAVFRALKVCAEAENDHERFKSTDSFITIKLGCICAIRCMKDTFVDLCIR